MAKANKEISEVNKDPNEKNWKRFYALLAKSPIKQYRVVYRSRKLKNRQDLYSSVVELFDAKGRLIGTVPIYEKKGKKIRGATKYLTGLSNINRYE